MATLAFAASAPPTEIAPASPRHRIKLKPLVIPPTGTIGLFVNARVDGGPPLRLLLDSGSKFLVLDKHAATRSGCVGGTPLDLIGAGAANPMAARLTKAGTVEVGEIALHDVDVAVLAGPLLEGIDGVLPLAMFAGFLIRVDFPAKSLELIQYPGELTAGRAPGASAVINNRMLFVKGVLNDSHEGYFMLDTGAAYNAISTTLARQMNSAAELNRAVPVRGGTAQTNAHMVTEILRLRVGSRELRAEPALAVDLSLASRYHNLEVSGLLGFPALRNCIVTVDYRQGLVQIDR